MKNSNTHKNNKPAGTGANTDPTINNEIEIDIDSNQAPDAQTKDSSKQDETITNEEKAKAKKSTKSASAKKIDELAVERDKYLRLAAEYKNFRDRSAKEREMIYTDARMDTVAKLLPVYDNLERALKMECTDEAFYKGVKMTMTGLLEIFESLGVKPIPAVGEPFDPNHHNAVMMIENPKLGSKIVAEELQKGFILGDKVIRFSTVVVAN